MENKNTKEVFAMKAINKNTVREPKHLDHVMSERNVLAAIDNSFCVNMHKAFASNHKLIFIMDFLNGGELFYHLRKEKRFTENKARFYTAEMVLAIEHLHS